MKIETVQFQRYRFWITGERQFSDETFEDFPTDYDKESIKDWVEEWVHSLWYSSTMVKYGYEAIGWPFNKHRITLNEREIRPLLNVPIADRIDSLYINEYEITVTTLPAFMAKTSEL